MNKKTMNKPKLKGYSKNKLNRKPSINLSK